MPKKIKTKYTMKSDGRICLTKVYNGKRKYFCGCSDDEVEAKMKKYEAELNKINSEGRNFKTIAEEWWEQTEAKLSPNSVMTYLGAYNRAVDHFGNEGMKSITPRDTFLYLGEYGAKSYSQKVIARHKAILTSIFDYAFLLGDVDFNPVKNIPAVKGKPVATREPASEEDISRIEAVKTKSNFGRMMYFMLWTGTRRGEAAAIQQKHINRNNNTASIVQNVAFDPSGNPVIKSPKTASGIRQVILPERVIEILPEGDPESYVFFPDGLPGQHELERGLKRFQDENGIKATAHQLRHAYASMLFSAGDIKMKESQLLLGHSSEKTTADVYTHFEKKHTEELNKKVKEYLDAKEVKNNDVGK